MAFVKSLRAKVLLAAVVPTVIVLVVVALIAFYAYQQVTRDVVKQRDTELAKISAARLAEGLSTHIQDLKNATAMDDVQSLEAGPFESRTRSSAGPAQRFRCRSGGIQQ